jgi:hypothetical protein
MVLYGMKEYEKALTACQDAMEADKEKKHTREIEGQMQKCVMETYAQRSGETDEETLARAMKDPEIGAIMVSRAGVERRVVLIVSSTVRPRHAVAVAAGAVRPESVAGAHEEPDDQAKDPKGVYG